MAKDIRVTLTLDDKNFKNALRTSTASVKSFQASTGSLNGSFVKLAATIGTVVASFKALDAVKSTGAEFEDLRSSLNAVFGGVEQGAAAFDRVKKFATQTQFSVQTLTKAFTQLKGAGVEPTEEFLQILADTASVSTDQLGVFQSAIDLVTRSTAGGLGLEELNRLGDRSIPVWNILQEKLNKSRLELSKFGQTAEGANKIIAALTEGLEERFGGASLARANNLNQIINNLGDAVDSLNDSLFQSGLGDFYKEIAAGAILAIQEIESIVNANQGNIEEFIRNLSSGLTEAIGNFIIGTSAFISSLEPLFKVVTTGINNLLAFYNNLPPVIRELGIVGFLLLGKKGKLAVVGVGALLNVLPERMQQAVTNLGEIMGSLPEIFGDTQEGILDGIDKPIGGDEKASLLSNLTGFTPGELDNYFKQVIDAYNKGRADLRASLDKDPVDPKGKDEEPPKEPVATGFQSGLIKGLSDLQDKMKDTSKMGEDLFNNMTSSWENAFVNFAKTGKLSFKDLFASLATELIKLAANQLFLQLFGGPTSIFGGLFAGFFAKGGTIPSGQFGIVGESGPELVKGPASVVGTKDTSAMLGGGGATNVYYTIQAVDAPSFQSLVARDPEFIYSVTRAGQRRLPGAR